MKINDNNYEHKINDRISGNHNNSWKIVITVTDTEKILYTKEEVISESKTLMSKKVKNLPYKSPAFLCIWPQPLRP